MDAFIKNYHFVICERDGSFSKKRAQSGGDSNFCNSYCACREYSLQFFKMNAPLARISSKLGRNVITTFVRKHSYGGNPGENLPFDITNRYKLTAYFIVYLGSGLSAPYLIARHQLLKK